MAVQISACIITFNEEDNILSCLECLDFAEEIILVDSGSTDNTLQLAKENKKVKIYHRIFDNYINQKNYCMSLAQNEWIIAVDADERIPSELKQEILSIPESELTNLAGYYIPRLSFYLGKWIRHGGWYPNYQMRFFNRLKGKFSGLLVHETVSIDGQLGTLKNPLHHFPYQNISDHLKFIDRYSDLGSQEKFKAGKKSGVLFAIGKSIWKFIAMYFIRFGFLDGKEGLILAILGSYYNFLKYIKLYELNQQKNNTKHSKNNTKEAK